MTQDLVMDVDTTQTECARCQQSLDPDDRRLSIFGRCYCRDCMSNSGLTELGASLEQFEESVRFGFMESLGRGIRSAVVLNTVFAGTIFTCFLLIRFAFFMADLAAGKPFAADPVSWVFFFGFVWVVFGLLIVFSLVVGKALTSRSRTIRMKEQAFECRTGMGKTSIPLSDCVWSETPTGLEGLLLWKRPLVEVKCGKNAQDAFVCGFSEESRRVWVGILALSVGEPAPRIPVRQFLLDCLTGVALGGAFGLLIGVIIHLATGNPRWVAALTMVGFLDGFLWGCMCSVVRISKRFGIKQLPMEMNAGVVATQTFCSSIGLGAMLGFIAGMTGAVVCGAINAVFGAILWVSISREISRRRNAIRIEG